MKVIEEMLIIMLCCNLSKSNIYIKMKTVAKLGLHPLYNFGEIIINFCFWINEYYIIWWITKKGSEKKEHLLHLFDLDKCKIMVLLCYALLPNPY